MVIIFSIVEIIEDLDLWRDGSEFRREWEWGSESIDFLL